MPLPSTHTPLQSRVLRATRAGMSSRPSRGYFEGVLDTLRPLANEKIREESLRSLQHQECLYKRSRARDGEVKWNSLSYIGYEREGTYFCVVEPNKIGYPPCSCQVLCPRAFVPSFVPEDIPVPFNRCQRLASSQHLRRGRFFFAGRRPDWSSPRSQQSIHNH